VGEDFKIPRSSDLVEVIILSLKELGGAASSKQIDQKAIELLQLSSVQVSLKHSEGSSNRTEIQYRLAWARTLAKRRNLIRLDGRTIWSVV
jgi:restriction system protein